MKRLFYFIGLFSIFSYSFAGNIENATEKTSLISSIFKLETLTNIFFAFIAIFVSIIISKFINSKIIFYIEKKGDGQNREELIGVLTRVSGITFITLGFAIGLTILGVDMGIFMGGFGFGLGFTLKIFFSNFIAGIIMVTQDSYHNGDLIRVEGRMGYIKRINALFTEIEQFDGVLFFVPNVKFLENNVENFHINSKRRVEIKVGVDYETDIIKAKKVILQVLSNFPNILKAPNPEIIINNFENSSINLNIRFWIDSKSDYFIIKSNITETINLAFKQAGITIPFPQITLSNRNDFKLDIVNKK